MFPFCAVIFQRRIISNISDQREEVSDWTFLRSIFQRLRYSVANLVVSENLEPPKYIFF